MYIHTCTHTHIWTQFSETSLVITLFPLIITKCFLPHVHWLLPILQIFSASRSKGSSWDLLIRHLSWWCWCLLGCPFTSYARSTKTLTNFLRHPLWEVMYLSSSASVCANALPRSHASISAHLSPVDSFSSKKSFIRDHLSTVCTGYFPSLFNILCLCDYIII